ncbi:MAG: transposase [Rhizobiales bacterium]|nr:transposase [Hyphomicrobiales bacterium]
MGRFVLTPHGRRWSRIVWESRPTPDAAAGTTGGVEAVLWIARTGSPWRNLPALFGNWSTAFRRFSDWRKADVFAKLFAACSDEPDMEYAPTGLR